MSNPLNACGLNLRPVRRRVLAIAVAKLTNIRSAKRCGSCVVNDYRILGRLQQRMQQAAEQFSFERAGVLRDQWQQLQWLQRRIQQLKKATRRLNGVWILPGFDHGAHWMILRQGQLLESTAGPADPRSMLACEQARTAEVLVPQTHLQINLLMLLTSWIKKHPQQLGTLVPFEDIPQLFQGVRGQQRSA